MGQQSTKTSATDSQMIALDRPPELRKTFHGARSFHDLAAADLKRHNDSVKGPSDPQQRRKFYFYVVVLVLSGAANDFLGKTIYQILPGIDSGWTGLVNDHWATLCLATGAFTASSTALFFGRESFKDMSWRAFRLMIIPSLMDFWVTASRYLALIFLPASLVTLLKSGLQLVALSITRRLRGKFISTYQWTGLGIICIGLATVSLHTFLENALTDTSYTVLDSVYGVLIMAVVGVAGAVRNTTEEILLKEDFHFSPYFIVGVESLVSLVLAITFGICFFIYETTNPSAHLNSKTAMRSFGQTLSDHSGIILCFCMFMTVFFLKDTMQMKVMGLSNSLTRKMFQQLYPIFTFTFGLLLWLISRRYGDPWDPYSYLEIIGFAIVLYGGFLYFKEPKYGLPGWALTALGLSYGDAVRKSTDVVDGDKRLLGNDAMWQGGTDTAVAMTELAEKV